MKVSGVRHLWRAKRRTPPQLGTLTRSVCSRTALNIAVVLVAFLSGGVWIRHVEGCVCTGVDTVMVLHRFPLHRAACPRFSLFGFSLFGLIIFLQVGGLHLKFSGNCIC